jgi:flavin reductase (DIM6/NTAB) family NADH-FMN oxidoreductase RutF
MEIDPAALSPRDAYRFLTACLVPRPIAWISTLDADGRANLAPFSFFGGLSSDPPTVMISVGRRKGARKDTARNLVATGEAVIHLPSRALAEAMVATLRGRRGGRGRVRPRPAREGGVGTRAAVAGRGCAQPWRPASSRTMKSGGP